MGQRTLEMIVVDLAEWAAQLNQANLERPWGW